MVKPVNSCVAGCFLYSLKLSGCPPPPPPPNQGGQPLPWTLFPGGSVGGSVQPLCSLFHTRPAAHLSSHSLRAQADPTGCLAQPICRVCAEAALFMLIAQRLALVGCMEKVPLQGLHCFGGPTSCTAATAAKAALRCLLAHGWYLLPQTVQAALKSLIAPCWYLVPQTALLGKITQPEAVQPPSQTRGVQGCRAAA